MTTVRRVKEKDIEPRIICGLELELEYNTNTFGRLNKSCYHDTTSPTWFNDDFSVETDGSLNQHLYPAGDTAEFVSRPFLIDDHKKVLQGFKEAIKRKAKITDLPFMQDYINFNQSTGSHIHISVVNNRRGIRSTYKIKDRGKTFTLEHAKPIYFKIVTPEFLISINNKILARVKRELPNISSAFANNFYRNYAKKEIRHDDRYGSWNFRTVGIEHVEFRSPHLYGTRTWDEFFKMIEIFLEVIQEEIVIAVKNRLVKEEIVSIKQDETDSDSWYDLKSETFNINERETNFFLEED